MIGTSSLSDEGEGTTFTTCPNGVPDAPVAVEHMRDFRTQTSFKVSFEEGNCDGNFAVESFRVHYKRANEDEQTMLVDGSVHYAEISGLEKDSYQVRVVANNKEGASEYSRSITIAAPLRTSTATVPPAPQDIVFHAEDATKTSMVVSWSQDGNGGSPITNYMIEVFKAGDNVPDEYEIDASMMETTLEDLEIGETYTISICAKNAEGHSEKAISEDIVFANRPDAPTDVETINDGDAIIIRWTGSDSDNGAEITSYKVHINQHFNHQWSSSDECEVQDEGADYFSCRVSVESL